MPCRLIDRAEIMRLLLEGHFSHRVRTVLQKERPKKKKKGRKTSAASAYNSLRVLDDIFSQQTDKRASGPAGFVHGSIQPLNQKYNPNSSGPGVPIWFWIRLLEREEGVATFVKLVRNTRSITR